jgi:hypothetical protein
LEEKIFWTWKQKGRHKDSGLHRGRYSLNLICSEFLHECCFDLSVFFTNILTSLHIQTVYSLSLSCKFVLHSIYLVSSVFTAGITPKQQPTRLLCLSLRYVSFWPINCHHQQDTPQYNVSHSISIPLGLLRPSEWHYLKQSWQTMMIKQLLASNHCEHECIG